MRIRDRNFLLILALVITTFCIVTAVLFSNFNDSLQDTRNITFAVIRSSLLQKFEDKSDSMADTISRNLATYMALGDRDSILETLRTVKNDNETAYVCLFDAKGNITADGSGNTSTDRNIRDIFSIKDISTRNIQWDEGRTILYAVSPIISGGINMGGVCLIRSSKFVNNAVDSLNSVLVATSRETMKSNLNFLFLAGTVIFILVLLSSYAIARRITEPVNILSGLIRKVGKGELDVAIPFSSRDEIGDLALSLQTMASEIKETTISRDDLRNILQSMHDGVIVVDPEGIIRDVNDSLTSLLHCPASKLLNMHIDSVLAMINENGNTNWKEFIQNDPLRDREISFTASSGKVVHFSLKVSPLRECQNLSEGAVFLFHDITEHRYLEKQLRYNAMHDSLTGLPNRTLLISKLQKVLKRFLHDNSATFDVLFLDLDRFKNINDNLGHGTGDEVLKVVGQRLVNLTRPFDLVSRFGGDEFVIILDNQGKPSAAEKVAKRILEGISRPVNIEGRQIYVSGSIGIVNSSNGGSNASEFLANADRAMYAAKARGRGNHAVYNATLMEGKNNMLIMESELREAIEDRRIHVHFQPIIATRNNRIAGFEALARWERNDGEMTPPGEFISLAEETGLILPLGKIVLENALSQLSEWNKAFPNEDFFISVNLSAPLFTDHDLYADIIRGIEDSGVSPSNIIMEITESLIITNPSLAVEILSKLKEKGVRIAIDDFGTGYSSLSFLHYFPFDVLKIDRSFVTNMTDNRKSMKIVRGITELAHTLDMKIVAEGVETAEDLQSITDLGCNYYQGFYCSPPLSGTEMAALIRNRTKLTYLKRDKEE